MANFNLNDYVMVNDRILKFYEKYPGGSIQTEIHTLDDGLVVMKAYAYRDREDAIPATGHAYEKEGLGYVNKTSYIENCETSAVGRALAMLGFEIKKSIASREEMEKVSRGSRVSRGSQVTTITEDQALDIKALLKEVDYTEAALLKVMKVGSIEDLPATKFKAAVAGLEKRRTK